MNFSYKKIVILGFLMAVCAPVFIAHAAIIGRPVSNTGLVGWWSFDEGTSTIAHDLSGNSRNGTLTNMAIPAAPTSGWGNGKKGKALVFDGSNDYINVGNVSAYSFDINTPFTLSAWIYPTTGTGQIFNKDTQSTSRYNFGLDGINRVQCNVSGTTGGGYLNGSTVLPLNTWSYVVCSYDGSSNLSGLKVFVNGVLDGTGSNSVLTGTMQNGISVNIGARTGGLAPFFAGSIDDLRVYNRTLSVSEIAALYGSTQALKAAASKTGIIAQWSLNEGSGTIAHDGSGNGNNGTLTSMDSNTDWVSGKLGKALDFDGINDYVLVTDRPSLDLPNTFSVSMWIYLRSGASTGFLIKGDGTVSGAALAYGWNSNGFQFIGWNSCNSPAAPALATDLNRWHHLVGTVAADGTRSLYVDGVLSGTPINCGTSSWNNANNLIIGGNSVNGYYGNAKIDDVRIYNKVLSQSDVSALYRSTETIINISQNTRVTDGLVNYWTFNGPDITTVVSDVSGQNNHGYFVGGATSTAKTMGKVGQGLSFDGVDDYVVSTSNLAISGNAEFTMCSWIKWNGAWSGDYPSFMGNNSTGVTNQGLSFTVRSGRPAIDFWVNRFRADNALSSNTWHHVCGTKTAGVISSTSKLYVNGGLVTGAVEGTDTTPNITAAPAVIGRLDAARWFRGVVDESRYYNRALSATEIKQLYTMGR